VGGDRPKLAIEVNFTPACESGRFARTDPLSDWLQPVKAHAAAFAGLTPELLVQAPLNWKWRQSSQKLVVPFSSARPGASVPGI
jgi:hypothetical protein